MRDQIWFRAEPLSWCAATAHYRDLEEVLAVPALDPRDCRRSQWKWRAGDAHGAIASAKDAIAVDPTWPHAHVTLAFYADRSGLEDPLRALSMPSGLIPNASSKSSQLFGSQRGCSPL